MAAYRRIRSQKRSIYLHREVARTPIGWDTDHINFDRLDNRKENLRIATRSQNNFHMLKYLLYSGKIPSSQFKGVTWDKSRKKWMAKTCLNRKRIFLGRFSSEIDAGRAYNDFVREKVMSFAILNEA
jgi:hypothetical protein